MAPVHPDLSLCLEGVRRQHHAVFLAFEVPQGQFSSNTTYVPLLQTIPISLHAEGNSFPLLVCLFFLAVLTS